jgi:hypothetical protein
VAIREEGLGLQEEGLGPERKDERQVGGRELSLSPRGTLVGRDRGRACHSLPAT